MPTTSPIFEVPTLDDSVPNLVSRIEPISRNEEHESTYENSPTRLLSYRPSSSLSHHRSHSGGDSSHDREFYAYMSEPSVSEDGGSSSQYMPISPQHGGSIHMNDSPSNTSLSSLGSPGGNQFRRKIFQQYTEKVLTPTGALVASEKKCGETVLENTEKDGNDSKHISKSGGRKLLCQNNEESVQKEIQAQPTCTGLHSKINNQQKSSNVKIFKPVQREDATTPESQRYMTAIESSDDEDGQSTSSGGLSYDSSSQEGQTPRNKNGNFCTQDKKHFLNNPLPVDADMDLDISPDSKGEEKQYLLSNTDSGPMDTSSAACSPEDLNPQNYSHSTTLETPNRYDMQVQCLEDDENITPIRKTSRESHKKLSQSELSKGKTIDLSIPITDVDETKEVNPDQRRPRLSSSEKRSLGHRRTRSGDEAAATLLTGSSEWIGMELDKLPLPNERDADNYQEEDVTPNDTTGLKRKTSQQRWKASRKNSPVHAGNPASEDSFVYSGKDITNLEEGISTRFSPRVTGSAAANVDSNGLSPKAGLHRNLSFGEVSFSDTESHFSWISNRGSSVKLSGGETDFSQFQGFPSNQVDSTIITGRTPPATNTIRGIHHDVEMQAKGNVDTYNNAGIHTMASPIHAANNTAKADKNKDYPMFTCPKCKTEQRNFFTVTSAPNDYESPAGYLVSYFIIYMIMSLFIFGMEVSLCYSECSIQSILTCVFSQDNCLFLISKEGWPAMDCVYFSVTTLTTTGLGDYVPTTDSAKIICSIFIYFGVACIGLLLGSLHASSLDDAAKKQTQENLISNCPNCNRRRQSMKVRSLPSGHQNGLVSNGIRRRNVISRQGASSPTETSSLLQSSQTSSITQVAKKDAIPRPLHTIDETLHHSNHSGNKWEPFPKNENWTSAPSGSIGSSPGSASPVETMGRQSHTRHYPIDDSKNIFDPEYSATSRKRNGSEQAIPSFADDDNISDIDNDDHNSQVSAWSGTSSPTDDGDLFKPVSTMKAAKYVILTLKQAGANSLFVIAIGSFGFYYIENLTAVDSFYFTMVLLTTVGYGDIVPQTPEGKLFATIYGLIALAVLLHNMSKISMIPLELRKRRIERAVLMQVCLSTPFRMHSYFENAASNDSLFVNSVWRRIRLCSP